MTNHIKIQGVIPRIQYVANGTLTTYTFPFGIFSSDNVEVYLNDTKQSSTTYTVSGVRESDGGSITFSEAPESGTVITIVRNLSIERTSDFQEGGALRADTLNDEFDYQIACQQQIADNLNRSMVLPPYALDTNIDLTLPTPAAGKAIVWNSAGTNLENSTIEVNALESTIKGYKTAAQSAATTATNKASLATTQAETATTQAGIATTKAAEAANSVTHLNSQRTNCVVEIPQDIKLELNEGSLVLKAGSKIYIPNGSGVFNTVTIANDITVSSGYSTATQVMVFNTGTSFITDRLSNCTSGTTTPVSGIFYNTSNNTIQKIGSSAVLSLPIAIVKTDNTGAYASIEKIFNGFGYIGSTIFSLPGVKGLIPNGRNADGTLKSIAFTTTSVLSQTRGISGTNAPLVLKDNDFSNYSVANYNLERNINIGGTGTNIGRAVVGTWSANADGVITDFKTKEIFCMSDLNSCLLNDLNNITQPAKSIISNFGLPNYSAGVSQTSDTNYTAASNGYIKWGVNIANNQEASLVVNGATFATMKPGNPTGFQPIDGLMIPIPKGTIYKGVNVSMLIFYPCIGG